jgi:hypothetical protein
MAENEVYSTEGGEGSPLETSTLQGGVVAASFGLCPGWRILRSAGPKTRSNEGSDLVVATEAATMDSGQRAQEAHSTG